MASADDGSPHFHMPTNPSLAVSGQQAEGFAVCVFVYWTMLMDHGCEEAVERERARGLTWLARGTVSTGGARICRAGGEWAGFWGASVFAVKTFCW